MSAVNLEVPDQIDGTNTGSRSNTVDATNIAPDSEHKETFGNSHLSESQRYLPEQLNSSEDLSLFPSTQLTEKVVNEVPLPTNTGIASSHFSHAYTNGCGAAQASVRHQPHVSGKRRIGSTTSVCTNSSKKSCKSTASQIQEVAGDDRCAHCALACLFCEFMSLCSLALDCGGCGGCLDVCCSGDGGEPLAEGCCGEASTGNCPCGLGCGMLQDCCSSSDCLEICLECCSICFPA